MFYFIETIAALFCGWFGLCFCKLILLYGGLLKKLRWFYKNKKTLVGVVRWVRNVIFFNFVRALCVCVCCVCIRSMGFLHSRWIQLAIVPATIISFYLEWTVPSMWLTCSIHAPSYLFFQFGRHLKNKKFLSVVAHHENTAINGITCE